MDITVSVWLVVVIAVGLAAVSGIAISIAIKATVRRLELEAGRLGEQFERDAMALIRKHHLR